jgi:hypothetical protein
MAWWRQDEVRSYSEIRCIVVRLTAFSYTTKSIVLAEWPEHEAQGYFLFAIDPEDEVVYSFWQEQGHPALRTLT